MEVPTLESASTAVPETLVLVGPPAAEVTGGVEETVASDWSVLSCVTLRGGVESEVSSDSEVCWCWVPLGSPVKPWVPLDSPGLPVSGKAPLKEWVMCWSVVSLLLALVDGAL